jgi:hypothetical protein
MTYKMKALVGVMILILTSTVSPAVPANMLHTISFVSKNNTDSTFGRSGSIDNINLIYPGKS